MHEESPEGGRFKKEIFINDQSYLLLIRDEGGVPESQVQKIYLYIYIIIIQIYIFICVYIKKYIYVYIYIFYI